MNKFFLNNSENIGFLIIDIMLIVIPLLVLFFLLLLIARKSDKSNKQKLRSIGSVLWEILSISFLCGFMFFIGFDVRDHMIYVYPDWNDYPWKISIILLGVGFVVFIYTAVAIIYIPLMFLIKLMKRG